MFKAFLIMILLFSAGVAAQTTGGPPTPHPQATPNPNRITIRPQETSEHRSQTENGDLRRANRRRIPAGTLADIKEIYRDATQKEIAALPPDDEDLKSYKAFLRERNTGIVRLADTAKCSDSLFVISAEANCVKYSMPGHGAFFSFRRGGYSIDRLADIGYEDGIFAITGNFKHGMLTGLGKISLNDIDVSHPGLRYLVDFEPSQDMESAVSAGRKLAAGADADGFYYRQALNVIDGMVYGIRSIAYRGSVPRTFNGYVYDELDFDKRLDVIVVFKVVRLHTDGSVTIIWKRLRSNKAPELKVVTTDEQTPRENGFTTSTRAKLN